MGLQPAKIPFSDLLQMFYKPGLTSLKSQFAKNGLTNAYSPNLHNIRIDYKPHMYGAMVKLFRYITMG
jgi:hypothetical protein